MKRIYSIISCVALLASLAACDHSAKYQTAAFARLSSDTYSIKEDGGMLRIPVSVFNNDGQSTNVTFKLNNISAKEGDNYTVEPANGVLSFEGNGTHYVTFYIVNKPGEYTGNVALTMELTSATNDVEVCAMTTARITIEDKDHPLADILGLYTVNCYGYNVGDIEYQMTLYPDDDDITIVWCDAIVPMFANYKAQGDGSIFATVSEDHNVLTFKAGQSTKSFNVGYGIQQVYGCHYDGGYYVDEDDIVFTRQPDGTFTTDSGICCLDCYVWPSDGGFILGAANGHKIVWTPAQ